MILRTNETLKDTAWLNAIFGLAVLLRLLLAAFNRSANDPHIEVIVWIADMGVFPEAGDCWQCYHAKLYHSVCALLINLFQIEQLSHRILLSQLINVVAGSVTLLVFYRFLMRLNIGSYSRIMAFALIALNPKLIGINAQVTNDSFVILFSTLSIFSVWVYIKAPSFKAVLGVALFTALAGITKGSGLVLFIGVVAVLLANLVGALKGKEDIKARALSIALVVVLFTVTAGIFGPYYSNYRNLGSPTAINIEKQPRAHFFEKTYVERPGVVSIFDSYFTFRLIDMLKRPHVTNDTAPIPLHRTSFWSQLYGRAHSVHFDYWPLRWQTLHSAWFHW